MELVDPKVLAILAYAVSATVPYLQVAVSSVAVLIVTLVVPESKVVLLVGAVLDSVGAVLSAEATLNEIV